MIGVFVVSSGVENGGTIALLAAILIALVGVIGAMVKMWPAVMDAAHHSEAANNAVNNVGPGNHSMYDIATAVREDVAVLVEQQRHNSRQLEYLTEAQRAFSAKGWDSLPDDIGSGPALTEKIRSLEHNDRIITESLADLRKFLADHDAWERSQKYGN